MTERRLALLRRLCDQTDVGIRHPQKRSWLRPQDLYIIDYANVAAALKALANSGYADRRELPAPTCPRSLYRISQAGRDFLESIDGPGSHAKPEPYMPLIEFIEARARERELAEVQG